MTSKESFVSLSKLLLWKKIPEMIYTHTMIVPKVCNYIHHQLEKEAKAEGRGEIDC